MPNEKKISRIKDVAIIIGFIVTFGSVMIGWSNERTKRALLEDQVNRNTKELETYDLKLITYRLDDIDESLDKILIILEGD